MKNYPVPIIVGDLKNSERFNNLPKEIQKVLIEIMRLGNTLESSLILFLSIGSLKERKIKQEIINGVLQPKKYDLSVDIPYGSGLSRVNFSNRCYLYDLDVEMVKELVTRFTEELEKALKV